MLNYVYMMRHLASLPKENGGVLYVKALNINLLNFSLCFAPCFHAF